MAGERVNEGREIEEALYLDEISEPDPYIGTWRARGLRSVPRQRCAKCGEVPNYFLHSRVCNGEVKVPENKFRPKKMCPKCHEKLAYGFHVKFCPGPGGKRPPTQAEQMARLRAENKQLRADLAEALRSHALALELLKENHEKLREQW